MQYKLFTFIYEFNHFYPFGYMVIFSRLEKILFCLDTGVRDTNRHRGELKIDQNIFQIIWILQWMKAVVQFINKIFKTAVIVIKIKESGLVVSINIQTNTQFTCISSKWTTQVFDWCIKSITSWIFLLNDYHFKMRITFQCNSQILTCVIRINERANKRNSFQIIIWTPKLN